MTDEGEFTGFIGAQKASISAWQRIWRKFQTDEQRAASQTIVSTEFNNIALVNGEFIYVTTSSIKENTVLGAIRSKSKSGDYAPVKMLNAAEGHWVGLEKAIKAIPGFKENMITDSSRRPVKLIPPSGRYRIPFTVLPPWWT